MIISLVNGSPRSAGATGKVLQAAAAYLARKPGVEIRTLDLARRTFEFCRGCEHCYRTGCCAIQRDGLEEAAAALKASDGIIVGSPTHGSNVSAVLKNFLDRGHFIVEQSLRGKYGFSVSTFEIADGGQVNRILNKFFLVSGARRCGSSQIRVNHNADPLASPAARRRLERRLERFYRQIARQQPRSLFEQWFTDWLLIRMIWAPFIRKRREQYAGVLAQWKAKNIPLGGAAS